MKSDDIKRLNFYERQFLRTQDFQDEQAYHIAMRRRHLIAQHTWGIVVGLEITQDETSKVWSVQPGMAVDGFGREIIVFDPEPLDVNRIKSQLGTGTTPVQLEIWLTYRVEKANRPAAGYEVCDQPDQFTRIRETFRLIYQDDPPTKEGTIPSQPHEVLVDDPAIAPWPVYLGTITWDLSQSAITGVDSTKRRYVGLMGAEITPPTVAQNLPSGASTLKTTLTLRAEETQITGLETTKPGHLIVDGDVQIDGGKLDLRSSGGADVGAPLQAFRSGTKDFRFKIGDDAGDGAKFVVGPGSEEKFVVQGSGDTIIDGSISIKNGQEVALEGGRLAFKNADGTENPDITEISRQENSLTGHQDLQVGIGTPEDLGSRLIVGPKQGNKVEEKFVVKNDGSVGIGTANLGKPLSIRASGTEEDLIGFEDPSGTLKWHINQKLRGNKPGLNFVESGVADGTLFLKAGGNVGIGTTNPTAKLEVDGEIKANGIIRATDAFRPSTNDWEIARNGEDLEIREPEQTNKVWARFKDDVSFHLIGTPNLWVDGKVGIGTTTPDSLVQMHVIGDRIRLENSGKHLDLRADGGAVDLQTETNDLYIRSTGSGHDVVINPFSDDGKVGIGTENPTVQLHVQDSKSGPASIPDHVAFIENTSLDLSADVLALKVARSTPTTSNNFITFFGGSSAVGRIEGNGSGGIVTRSGGADYAECLPRIHEGEAIAPAEIVGVFAGKVTKATDNAHHTAVVSNRSIVIGNMPQQEEEYLYEDVAFLGQVPVKVWGKVKAGDYIVPSGRNDGTGIAVSPQNLTLTHYAQIVGRAWESSEEEGIKSINTVVGLPSSYPGAEMAATIQRQQTEIETLRADLEALKAVVMTSQQFSPETNTPVVTGIA